MRATLAAEAARLIVDQGVRSPLLARRKAAERLGLRDPLIQPALAEIEAAVRERLRLFAPPERGRWLAERRRAALDAMRFFAPFEPRLVGAVLDGSADRHSAICLHLFTDDPLAVVELLWRHGIPFEEDGRRLRLDREREAVFPVLRFVAGEDPIDLTVLPLAMLRQPPLERGGERPMARASRAALERLLAEESR
ncbi:MAG: hypothetical protein RML12_03305 [Xanthomonadales bacterium]|nr:hypothetical protein [Xanthomonadales bacterium]